MNDFAPDRLRNALSDLAQEVQPVDLQDRALSASRRIAVSRAVVASVAAVAVLAIGGWAVVGMSQLKRNAQPLAPAASGTVSATSTPSVSAPPVGPDSDRSWVGPYVGSFSGHGYHFTIDADGSGQLRYRTYINCQNPQAVAQQPGVPCEDPDTSLAGRVTFQLVRRDDRVYAHITESNDVAFHGDLVVRLLRQGIVAIDGPHAALTGCADGMAPVPPACGGP